MALGYVVDLITPDPALFTTAVNAEREENYSPNTTFLMKAFLLQNSKTFHDTTNVCMVLPSVSKNGVFNVV